MRSKNYQDLLWQIDLMPNEEKLQLLEDLVRLIRERPNGPTRSILELEGLGAEVWKGIDAQEYVDQERDSWGG